MIAKFWGQHEIREGYQAIFWYIFLAGDSKDNPDDLLDNFLHSETFGEFCLPFIVKKQMGQSNRFLQRAFNQETVSLSNFKIFGKGKLLSYLNDYANAPDWSDDRNDFVAILNRFKELLQQEDSDRFFLISKEWFNKGDEILNTDSEVYIYYFLIIWFDAYKKVVNICEWYYD